MNVQQWLAAVSLAAMVIGAFVRGERRMGKFLTRDEHEKICEQRNQAMKDLLEVIRDDIREVRDWSRDR